MIIRWLAEELADVFRKDPRLRVALWFDEKQEFARLLDAGLFPPADAPFTLLRHRLSIHDEIYQGPLWLKGQMIWETRHLSPEERAARRYVLYLPFSRESLDVASHSNAAALDYLLEYKYSGRAWLIDGREPTLFSFLRKHGVPLPQTQKEQRALWEGGADSLLAKCAARFAQREPAFWSQPLDAKRANQLLVGELEEHLFLVLADPERAVSHLQERELLAEFEEAVAREFGYTRSLRDDPRAWVKDFTARLALTECFVGFGQPDDFPFRALVPDAHLRGRWLSFWKRWVSDRDQASVYNLLVRQVENDYDLSSWAAGRSNCSHAFYHLARARWDACFHAFQGVATGRTQLENFLRERKAVILTESRAYWASSTGDLPGWGLLAMLCELVEGARQALTESAQLTQPADFIEPYAQRWYRVDYTYWRILKGVRQHAGMEPILAATNLWYVWFLDELNSRFFNTLIAWGDWAAWGPRASAAGSNAVWAPKTRTAVLVTDALRYDLAAALSEQLRGVEASVEAWVTTVPSITSVGMTALMPLGGDAISAVLNTGKLELLHDQYGNLSLKTCRRRLLADRCRADCMELPTLLEASEPPSIQGNLLVVFTNEIDELGHTTGREMAKHLDQLLADLKLAVEKLHRFGFEQVHIVTDHGFLLVANGFPTSELPITQTILRGDRYAFLAEGAVVDQFTLPFPMDGRQCVAFPPGLACFTSRHEYLHGGLALQEIVVPHVATWSIRRPQKMRVQCALTATETATLTVKVILISAPPAPTTLYDQAMGRTLEVFISKDSALVSQAKTVTIEPSNQEQTQTVTIFLNDSAELKRGQVLTLHARDVDTEEELVGGLTLTVARDF